MFWIQKYPKGVEYQNEKCFKINVFLKRNIPQGCDIKVKKIPRDVFLSQDKIPLLRGILKGKVPLVVFLDSKMLLPRGIFGSKNVPTKRYFLKQK